MWQIARERGDWVSLPSTVRADVELIRLDLGSTDSVRVRSVTAEGPSDWQGPVRFLVA